MVFLVKNNGTKNAPTGFSWTTFFFGFFPAIIRGDIKWGLIMLGIALVTGGLSWLVFPFIYNKIYIKSLIEIGYKPKSSIDEKILKDMGVYEEDLFDNAVKTVSNIGANQTAHQTRGNTNGADDLKKWQELYKDGAITKEEYQLKKSEILNFTK